jgi:hypothetical protein
MVILCVIRLESLGVKVQDHVFLQVTIHINNIKTSLRVDKPQRKSDRGLGFH